MLPHYNYFAASIQEYEHGLTSFKITNHFLPPGWLGARVFPAIEAVGETSMKAMTNLTLSNCSLSSADLVKLVQFLARNETLCSIDISKNDVKSLATVNNLANAIKQHPCLVHVNLAHCSLGGGDKNDVKKMLAACKDCNSLGIGHPNFGSEGVALVAKFLGRKNSLTAFSLTGAQVDKNNKELLTASLVKSKNIFRSIIPNCQ
ncbi:hypothetical protein ACHAWO_000261 [Cyclotella atomus]|jgi:acyl carrier protein|uniref:Uncharacterized protein n=1 Tax=Cyclotella atomus TaxID=382360 RepID=A0ABD3PNQ5_9STRA